MATDSNLLLPDSHGSFVSPAAAMRQCGALPVRIDGGGTCQILLITTKRSQRWIAPKGWPLPGRSSAETAAVEAYEEAGVRGKIGAGAFGAYAFEKSGQARDRTSCIVDVHILQVIRIYPAWPEMNQRQRRWFTVPDAIEASGHPHLATLIKRHAGLIEKIAAM